MDMQLLLASGSPRRRELINMLRLSVECVSVDADESIDSEQEPTQAAITVAARKARAAFDLDCAKGKYIVSADTMVVLNGRIYGKPSDREDAKAMLRTLSGRTHDVLTGVCIIAPDGRSLSFCDRTQVCFYPLTDDDIAEYVETGEPMDKAGAYGIQGQGALLIKSITGDYYNVMGLPIARLKRSLRLLAQ